VLSDTFGLPEISVHHPGDIRWDRLPPQFVIQLHWRRTELLEQRLRAAGITVITASRHPLDVLLSMLVFAQRDRHTSRWLAADEDSERTLDNAVPGDPAFLEWAGSDRARSLLNLTAQWWQAPSVVRVRYEELCADPEGEFTRLIADTEQDPACSPTLGISINTPQRLSELSGGVHVWHARPGMWREVLSPEAVGTLTLAHSELIAQLGY
jgi:hypothetical protein